MKKRLDRGTRLPFNDPGHAHEFTFCCYHGYKLLSKARTREWFVDALDRARRIHHFLLIAYVIMPEHAHLLTVPERWEYKTSKFLKSVKKGVSQHAMSFLEKQQRSDWLERLTHRYPGGKVERHFWQPGGGYDRNIVAPGAPGGGKGTGT